MDRIFRSNSSTSSRRSSSSKMTLGSIPPIVSSTVNEEHYSINSDKPLDNNWIMPSVSPDEIYYQKSWSLSAFKSETHVKTVEQVYYINKNFETCQLLNKENIEKHIKDGYNFLHIGLVQVGLNPLTLLGLNAAVLVTLRDASFRNYKDEIFGVIETSLCNGPVHFDCYPNCTISLTDPCILKVLTLNIKTSGYDVDPGRQPLALIYRIHYKVSGANMNFKAKRINTLGYTTLIQSTQQNIP